MTYLPVMNDTLHTWFLLNSSYTGGNPNCEFGDVSVVNCLTGWLPEAIPLQ